MQLRTLGSVALDGSGLRRPKPLMLLAYLALEGPTNRQRLAGLFWPTANDPRDSLGTTLRRLRRAGAGLLRVAGERVEAAVACDAVAFERASLGKASQAVVSLYGGPFLDGMTAPLGEEAEEWVFGTRERLASRVRDVHVRLASTAIAGGRRSAAARHAEAALDVRFAAPLEGRTLATLVTLLERSGSARVQEALREAERFGVRIGDGDGAETVLRSVRTSLPAPTTSFVGRSQEIASIQAWFATPHARLVTIHGPAGVGKTRLAVEVARSFVASRTFAGGTAFVPLESVRDAVAVPDAIASAMRMTPPPATGAADHVLATIASSHVLLVLDNFEHLAGASPFVSTLIRTCPHVRVVVTSRHVLGAPEEHGLRLEGLPTATSSHVSPAARLLRDRIAQVAGSGSDDERAAIEGVCAAVAGNPLALELAASLTRSMPLAGIADALTDGIDVLRAHGPRTPDRHHNLRAALDVSWRLLSEPDRDMLARLSVFRGGFDGPAARAVAGASTRSLGRLVDRAWLRLHRPDRFDWHPLVQSVAREHLDEDPAAASDVEERHACYVLTRLEHAAFELQGGEHAGAWIAWIETEFGNVERAWAWAVEHGALERYHRAIYALAHHGELRARYAVVASLLEAAIAGPIGTRSGRWDDRTAGELHGCLTFMRFRMGLTDAALDAGRIAVGLLTPIRAPSGNWGLWTAHQGMGATHVSLGAFEHAREHFARAIATAEGDRVGAGDDPFLRRTADVLNGATWQPLAFLEIHRGDFREAIACLERSRALLMPHRAPFLAYVYWSLGQAHAGLGEVAQARSWLEEGLEFTQAIGFTTESGHIRNELARVYLTLGALDRADTVCDEALAEALDSGDRWLQTSLWEAKGRIAVQRGDIRTAHACFRTCLDTARSFGGFAFAMDAVRSVAELAIAADSDPDGFALLAFVASSRHTPKAVADAAAARQSDLVRTSPGADLLAALERGRGLTAESALMIAASRCSGPAIEEDGSLGRGPR